MKNVLMVGLLAGAALSSSAFGDLRLSAEPIEGGGGYLDRNATVYSSLTGGYASFAAAAGNVGFDDYTTSNASDLFVTVAQFKFVGGVQTVGGIATFNFFDSTGTQLMNSFGIAFPQAGAFIWTITLGALPDGSDSTFSIPTNGIVQMQVDAATTGRFFLTATGNPAPLVGANDPAFGAGAALQRNQAFSIEAVPTPGALALVGVGGLLAARRRRA